MLQDLTHVLFAQRQPVGRWGGMISAIRRVLFGAWRARKAFAGQGVLLRLQIESFLFRTGFSHVYFADLLEQQVQESE